MNELALFAGAGGGILGGHLLGWKTVAACEIEDYPRETLLRRQLDGIIPRFPIWDDINTFDGTQFRDRIDIITGGFPCQDISAAGKGAGIDGVRSGLWKEMHRIIGEVRPRYAFMENSPLLTSRGLGTVLGDLAEVGYDAEWTVLGADDVGAPHRRKRIWILAYSRDSKRRDSQSGSSGRNGEWELDERIRTPETAPIAGSSQTREVVANKIKWWEEDPAYMGNAESIRRYEEQTTTNSKGSELQGEAGRRSEPERRSRREVKPRLGRVAHGVANRVDRLKAIGNGQVPAVAAVAFLILYKRIVK